MCHPIDFTNCTSSCKTGNHATYGECLRAKGLSTASGDTTKSSPPTKPNDALTKKGASSALRRATKGTCPDCRQLGWHTRECPQVATIKVAL